MAYTREYWQQNKSKFLARRQERYQNDPAYRAAALERSRAYRAKKKEAEGGPTQIIINGEVIPSFRVEDFPPELSVTKLKLKYLQKQGYVPQAIVSRPFRLYTLKQAQMIRDIQTFLDANRTVLRNPASPQWENVKHQLDTLVSTIHTNWNT